MNLLPFAAGLAIELPPEALPPLAVLVVGAIIGVLLSRDNGSDAERRAVDEQGRRTDLESKRDSIVAALKQLDLERGKLSDAQYGAERDKLVKAGADVLRRLDTDPAQEQEDTLARELSLSQAFVKELEAERTRLGGDGLREALAQHLGMSPTPKAPTGRVSPEWRGAMWTLAGVALAVALLLIMQSAVSERGDGPMTGATIGGGGGGGGGGGKTLGDLAAEGEEKARAMTALAANPQDINALNTLTELSFVEKDLGAAMDFNRRALEAQSTDHTARTYKAVLQSSVGMLDPALTILDEVLAEDPGFKTALVYKGLIAFDAGKFAESADALEHALAGAPPNPYLQSRLAEAQRMAGTAGGTDATPAPPEVVVSGTISLAAGVEPPTAGSAIVFVSVRSPAGGPPLAALRLPPGPFPMDFQVTTADAISMGGAPRPFPPTMNLKVKIDTDGNAMTTEAEAPTAVADGVAKGADDLAVVLAP